MATYYVRPDGNNLNDGLGPGVDHAWATNSKAATTMVTGDKTITGPGTYRELIQPVAAGVEFFADYFAANFPDMVPGKVRVTGLDDDASAASVRYNAFKITTDNVKISGLWYLDSFKTGAVAADQAAIYISGKFPWVSGPTIRGAAGYGVYFANTTWTGSYGYDQTIFERMDIESTLTCICQVISAAYAAGVTVKDNRLFSISKACIEMLHIGGKCLRNDCQSGGGDGLGRGATILVGSSGSSNAVYTNRALVLGNKVTTKKNDVAISVGVYKGNAAMTHGGIICGNVVNGTVEVYLGTASNDGSIGTLWDIHGNEVLGLTSVSVIDDPTSLNKLTAYLRRNRFHECAQSGSFFHCNASSPNYPQNVTFEYNEFLTVSGLATNMTANYTMTWNGNRYALIGTGLVPADAGAVLGMPVGLAPVAVPGIETESPISGGKSLKIPVWGTNLGGQFLRIPVNAGNNTIRLKAKKTFAGGSVTFEVNQGTQVAMADNTDVQTIEVSGYQSEAGYCELRVIAETTDLAVNDNGADYLLIDDLEVV